MTPLGGARLGRNVLGAQARKWPKGDRMTGRQRATEGRALIYSAIRRKVTRPEKAGGASLSFRALPAAHAPWFPKTLTQSVSAACESRYPPLRRIGPRRGLPLGHSLSDSMHLRRGLKIPPDEDTI